MPCRMSDLLPCRKSDLLPCRMSDLLPCRMSDLLPLHAVLSCAAGAPGRKMGARLPTPKVSEVVQFLPGDETAQDSTALHVSFLEGCCGWMLLPCLCSPLPQGATVEALPSVPPHTVSRSHHRGLTASRRGHRGLTASP